MEDPGTVATVTDHLPDPLRARLLDLAADPVGVIAADGTVRFATRAAERAFGYDPGALAGRNILAFVHPADLEDAIAAMGAAAGTPGVHEPLRVRVRHARGDWRHIEVVANSQLDDPVVRGLVLDVRDVTEQVRADAARRAAEDRFRLAFEHAPIGMALVRPDGRWLQVNASLCRILGRTEAELLDGHVEDAVHALDRLASRQARDDAIAGRSDAYTVEHRWLAGDGHVVWGNTCVAVVRADDGAAEYCILQLEDVTDRRRLTAELDRRARHDDLTGLPNRAEALAAVRNAQAALGHRWLGLLFIDLDGFKAINDGEGHAAGDAALVGVARRLRTAVRAGDTAARLAGDEFVVCCGDVGPDEGEARATVVRVAARVLAAVESGGSRLSASVGAVVARADACDAEALLQQADAAMYAAKGAGGARLEVVTYR